MVQIIQWFIDTRELWPDVQKTAQLQDVASDYLDLLTPEERTGVLKYYFPRDAKMSLASHLLKHYVLSRALNLPWSETRLSRGLNKKPVFLTPDGRQPVAFNVSHQAGIVALAAVIGVQDSAATSTTTTSTGSGTEGGEGALQVDVGVDVVCVSERNARDRQMIAQQGWASFVDMHADVFGRAETAALKRLGGGGGSRNDDETARLLRRFYALWCLREAYVKMTGEALLAPWLHDLEFRDFRVPAASASPALQQIRPGGAQQPAEEVIAAQEMIFKGARVEDVNICLRSLGRDYMTCTALRTPAQKSVGLGWKLGPYEAIDVATILRHVEAESGGV